MYQNFSRLLCSFSVLILFRMRSCLCGLTHTLHTTVLHAIAFTGYRVQSIDRKETLYMRPCVDDDDDDGERSGNTNTHERKKRSTVYTLHEDIKYNFCAQNATNQYSGCRPYTSSLRNGVETNAVKLTQKSITSTVLRCFRLHFVLIPLTPNFGFLCILISFKNTNRVRSEKSTLIGSVH